MSKNEPAVAPLAANHPAAPKAVGTAAPLAAKPQNKSANPCPRPELMATHSPRAVRGGEMGI